MAKPATRGTRENVPPGIARNSLGRAVTGKVHHLVVAGLKDNDGEGDALSRAPHSTRPIPLGDPSSSIWGDGVDAPSRRHRNVPGMV
ncbi:MAG: hypothetical protein OXU74_06085, partial [Gemmatimonadota bacterium]|nr:hypothetical protein [Gemmatimonadota bacterium]